jgi:hypothetical protein
MTKRKYTLPVYPLLRHAHRPHLRPSSMVTVSHIFIKYPTPQPFQLSVLFSSSLPNPTPPILPPTQLILQSQIPISLSLSLCVCVNTIYTDILVYRLEIPSLRATERAKTDKTVSFAIVLSKIYSPTSPSSVTPSWDFFEVKQQ